MKVTSLENLQVIVKYGNVKCRNGIFNYGRELSTVTELQIATTVYLKLMNHYKTILRV